VQPRASCTGTGILNGIISVVCSDTTLESAFMIDEAGSMGTGSLALKRAGPLSIRPLKETDKPGFSKMIDVQVVTVISIDDIDKGFLTLFTMNEKVLPAGTPAVLNMFLTRSVSEIGLTIKSH
jgi:hypothetical protein